MKAVRILAPGLIVTLVALGSGCGGDDNKNAATTTSDTTTQPAQQAGGQTVTVAMDEFSFDPDKVAINRGGTIVAKNVGAAAHNLTIEQGPDPKKKTKKLAGTSTFLPGKSEKVKVDLGPGKYAMACTVAGHREAGMVGRVTVK
jgi:plastocyanin